MYTPRSHRAHPVAPAKRKKTKKYTTSTMHKPSARPSRHAYAFFTAVAMTCGLMIAMGIGACTF